jgi:signal peptidase II
MPQHKRRIKLIQPQLQLKLISAFVGMSALALTLQFLLFTSSLTELASELPEDGAVLIERVPAHVQRILLVSFLIFLPLTFCVGVLITFRIAGPLYRFEVYLKQVIRGERPPDCRLRKGDELLELCELLNQATAPLRVQEAAERSSSNGVTAERPEPSVATAVEVDRAA